METATKDDWTTVGHETRRRAARAERVKERKSFKAFEDYAKTYLEKHPPRMLAKIVADVPFQIRTVQTWAEATPTAVVELKMIVSAIVGYKCKLQCYEEGWMGPASASALPKWNELSVWNADDGTLRDCLVLTKEGTWGTSMGQYDFCPKRERFLMAQMRRLGLKTPY